MGKRIVIVGATSKIAEHCARLWGQEKDVHLVLVGRNEQKLLALVADLSIRCPTAQIRMQVASFMTPETIHAFVERVAQEGQIDLVLIAQGFLPVQWQCQEYLEHAAEALFVNGLSPALCAEAFAKKLEKQGYGTLAVISSVAGERGRKSNYVYGAAKSLLTCYVEGLQHRFADSKVWVVLIKPGPTATPMTAHIQGRGLANVRAVAKEIVQGIARKKREIYTPAKWKRIMMIIRHLPAFIFNKINI